MLDLCINFNSGEHYEVEEARQNRVDVRREDGVLGIKILDGDRPGSQPAVG